jgi:hypothetical protein
LREKEAGLLKKRISQSRRDAKKIRLSVFVAKNKMVFLVYLVKRRFVDPQNRVRFPKTPHMYERKTMVVCPPYMREAAGSSPVSYTNAGMVKLVNAADLESVF